MSNPWKHRDGDQPTVSRKTALAALQSLADADELITNLLHSMNVGRRDAIKAMCKELGVAIRRNGEDLK